MSLLSCILCTHNPRVTYLARTLDALRSQTLSTEFWELIIVDNASKEAVLGRFDLSGLPARVVNEPRLGLTQARLTGFQNARYDWLVLVDDDNLLAPDYLEQALRIISEHPRLGAFGGRVKGEFEVHPPGWILPHLEVLALRDLTRSVWSNGYDWRTTPIGAGMVLRTSVALAFAGLAKKSPIKLLLGRKGDSMASAEDMDLAYTALDLGYGLGRFTELELTHLIPKERFDPAYLERLFEGIAFSAFVLAAQRPQAPALTKGEWIQSAASQITRLWPPNLRELRFMAAKVKGMRRAKKRLQEGL
jgi:glycosyltransferase involved in cell wall biosynthesis